MKLLTLVIIALAIVSFIAWFQYMNLTCEACKRRKCKFFGIGCEGLKMNMSDLADQADAESNTQTHKPGCCGY